MHCFAYSFLYGDSFSDCFLMKNMHFPFSFLPLNSMRLFMQAYMDENIFGSFVLLPSENKYGCF